MSEFQFDDNAPILVEFSPVSRPPTGTGYSPAANPADATVALSEHAVQRALESVYGVARRVSSLIDAMSQSTEQRPLSAIEVEFGLKLDAEAGAFLAKAGTEAHFTVKLTWEPKHDQQSG